MAMHARALAGVAFLVLAGCGSADRPAETSADSATAAASAPAAVTPTRWPERAYFGDTHVHTGWSADAGMDGATTTPEDAFRFARGEEVKSSTGQLARLKRPLDWIVLTDHSDGMGVITEITSSNPEMMADPVVKGWAEGLASGDPTRAHAAVMDMIDRQSTGRVPKVVMDPKWMISAWKQTAEITDKYNEPGRFTAMIGYEWTPNPDGGNNQHRNVIYRDGADKAIQMLPLTTFQVLDPEGLWKWMAEYEAKTGGRVLASPHNGNLSNGTMFGNTRFDGSPMTRAYAVERQKREPLFELTQIKGQSESHPLLSPSDEFAAWDLWDRGNLNGTPKKPGMIAREYWREALKDGLLLENQLGVNPFKYGAQAATDTHTGLATADEDNFWGKFTAAEPGPERMNRDVTNGIQGWEQASAGYTGAWATANTREAIFDAMERRETFATTGPRISVRFFAGFEFTEADTGAGLVEAGYTRGVPMGGNIKAAPAGKAPTFLVAATKDPEGANLDRVQIVKGWLGADGRTHERIFDVKWSGDRKPDARGKLPPVGNTVDLATATYSNSIGAGELVSLWVDPEFDPALRAVYYVRVLEIPTPRWAAYDQVRFKVKAPEGATLIHQERAITSPIWYSPS
jgi:hypothetical protein